MAGLLEHSPADILRYLLINRGNGVLPGEPGEWAIFAHYEPSNPDNCITTYDTVGIRHGRFMMTGQTQLHYGLQVRLRSTTSPIGFAKASDITINMESVYDEIVTIDDSSYRVHSVNHASGPVLIGREADTGRMLHTINFLACIHSN